MSVTDYPTYDDAGEDDATIWCTMCGRPMREDESVADWFRSDDKDWFCPHCAGLEQAERQGA